MERESRCSSRLEEGQANFTIRYVLRAQRHFEFRRTFDTPNERQRGHPQTDLSSARRRGKSLPRTGEALLRIAVDDRDLES